jgi:hypothetical protein
MYYLFDFDLTIVRVNVWDLLEGRKVAKGDVLHRMSDDEFITALFGETSSDQGLFYAIIKVLHERGDNIGVVTFNHKENVLYVLGRYFVICKSPELADLFTIENIKDPTDITFEDLENGKNAMLAFFSGNKDDIVYIDDDARNIELARRGGYRNLIHIDNSDRKNVPGLGYDDIEKMAEMSDKVGGVDENVLYGIVGVAGLIGLVIAIGSIIKP